MKLFTWKQRIVVISTTLLCIGAFALGGLLIDYAFDSSPLGLIGAVLVSFPFTQWVVYKRMQNHLKKHPPIVD